MENEKSVVKDNIDDLLAELLKVETEYTEDYK